MKYPCRRWPSCHSSCWLRHIQWTELRLSDIRVGLVTLPDRRWYSNAALSAVLWLSHRTGTPRCYVSLFLPKSPFLVCRLVETPLFLLVLHGKCIDGQIQYGFRQFTFIKTCPVCSTCLQLQFFCATSHYDGYQ